MDTYIPKIKRAISLPNLLDVDIEVHNTNVISIDMGQIAENNTNENNTNENNTNVINRKIFISPSMATDNQINEIDAITKSFDTAYIPIYILVNELKYSIIHDTFRVTEVKSRDIIKQIDQLILIYRKLRKKFKRVGFSKLRTMNKACTIAEVISKIINIYELLKNIKNDTYPKLSNSCFEVNLNKGMEILDLYIEKLNILLSTSTKWLNEFFE